MSLAAWQAGGPTNVWQVAVGVGLGLLAIVWLVLYSVRRFFQDTREAHKEKILAAAPGVANPAAFMTASMQGVIQKLREQEKELERLHRIEKERAEHTERRLTPRAIST